MTHKLHDSVTHRGTLSCSVCHTVIQTLWHCHMHRMTSSHGMCDTVTHSYASLWHYQLSDDGICCHV